MPLKRNEMEELGYIVPGKQVLTRVLEFVSKDNSVIRMHALLRDASGMLHRSMNKGNGYYYRSWRENTPNWMKKSQLIGHLTGMTFFLLYLKNHKFIE